MATGTAYHHVAGGDRPVPTARVTYKHDLPKPKGLDWENHRAPEPPKPDPAKEPKPRPGKRKPAGKPHKTIKSTSSRPRPSREDPTLIRAVTDAYTTNPRATIGSVATTAGCSMPTVRRILADAGITVRRQNGGPYPGWGVKIDTAQAKAELDAGHTIPEIGARHGWPLRKLRATLKAAGVQYADGRWKSGGHNKVERTRPELPDLIHACYLDQGMSMAQTAEWLHISLNAMTRIMSTNNIPAREGACGAGDTLTGYRAWFGTHTSVTAAQVRAWALDQGFELHHRGVIRHEVLDAWDQAHP